MALPDEASCTGGKGVQWQGSFNVPGKLAIARRVIASWLEQHPAATHPLEVRAYRLPALSPQGYAAAEPLLVWAHNAACLKPQSH